MAATKEKEDIGTQGGNEVWSQCVDGLFGAAMGGISMFSLSLSVRREVNKT